MRERVEQAARQLVRFTVPDLARALGLRPDAVRAIVHELEAEHRVFRLEFARNGKQGRPPRVYAWCRQWEELAQAPDPREDELPRFERPIRGAPVAGTGGHRPLRRKDLRAVVAAIRAQGWRLDPCGTGHVSVYDADGRYVTTFAGSPSDWRSDANAMADLRRAGLPV
jgi:hypothetical protein